MQRTVARLHAVLIQTEFEVAGGDVGVVHGVGLVIGTCLLVEADGLLVLLLRVESVGLLLQLLRCVIRHPSLSYEMFAVCVPLWVLV